MTFDKTDGAHFSLSVDWRGNFAVFFPETRSTFAVAFGFAWRPVGVAECRPFFTLFRFALDRGPFVRLYFLRAPYNRVRVGEWQS